MKVKKSRTAKIYTMNIERKRILKQRREKTLQNAKDGKQAKGYFLTASKASHKADRASKDTQKDRKSHNGLMNGDNMTTNTTTVVDNINNLKIVADNVANAATNAEDIDTEPIDTDNISNAEIEIDKSEDIVMSDDSDDKPAMSNKNRPHATSGNDNAENGESCQNCTEDVPSPLIYGRKMSDPTKIKTSKRHKPVRVTPLESPMGNPPVDKDTTGKAKGHASDPTDVQVYEFFIQGTPNPKDLEGVEEDQLLEIQRTIQEKLKERDVERERNITKRMKQYEQKNNFINKALLESVAQITEMTKSNHPVAAARVKSADKMVMLPPLFDGTKPEVAKQHYKRFNQYIKFQTKSGNIRDPVGEAIELFEHTLDKKALVWFQEHKDKFVDLTTLKTMFLQRYNPWGKTK